jgi:hypothetical protein
VIGEVGEPPAGGAHVERVELGDRVAQLLLGEQLAVVPLVPGRRILLGRVAVEAEQLAVLVVLGLGGIRPPDRDAVVVAEARREEDGGRVRLLPLRAGVHQVEDRAGVRVEVRLELLDEPLGIGLDLDPEPAVFALVERGRPPAEHGRPGGAPFDRAQRALVVVCHARNRRRAPR